MSAPILWFIITPKGNPAISTIMGRACAAKTRKACVELWCWDMTYDGITEAEVWAGWQKDGYTVEKRRVM